MIEFEQNIASGFLESARRFPERPALEVDGQRLSYSELKARACSLAATLSRQSPGIEPPLTAIFAYRSDTAFVAVLGSLLRGHGYVPLNPTFPVDRTWLMLKRAGCRTLIVDARCEPQLDRILSGFPEGLLVVLPHREEVSSFTSQWPEHRFVGHRELDPPEDWEQQRISGDTIAYLLFTSGSTGVPKAVMVAHRNVVHYINCVVRRYAISEADRLSQMFDMTFDLSVHDMFVAWERGACVCCPTQKQLINPGRFITDSQITAWFAVPSTAVFMKRLGALKPGMYPHLRISLFCGEALPVEIVKAWQEAAPNSAIENLYGPTELTIACTAYNWNPVRSLEECQLGLVPIGYPFPDMEALVVDEALHEVAPGADGELLMTGFQMSMGYWHDKERTEKAFVIPPGRDRIFYRTGDRVRRPAHGGPFVYLGRTDSQVKIHGHRVELGEIEAIAREESGIDAVVAVGWPVTKSGAGGVELFIEAESVDVSEIKRRVAARVPPYVVPRRIHVLSRFPVNPNGKYDRNALLERLQ